MEQKEFDNYSHSTRRPNQKMRDSSLLAFRDKLNSRSYSSDVDKVFAAMVGYGKPLTRKMLGRLSGFESNYITQYVKQLINDGKVVETKSKFKCKVSKVNAHYLKVHPNYGK